MKITIENNGETTEIESHGCVICTHNGVGISTYVMGRFSEHILKMMKKYILKSIKEGKRKKEKISE